jgi:hypothetical protein
VRVHATVNTLVKDAELQSLYKEIEMLAAFGIDAVIVRTWQWQNCFSVIVLPCLYMLLPDGDS